MLFIYLKGRGREGERKRESFICWFALQTAAFARAGLGQSQDPRDMGSNTWWSCAAFLCALAGSCMGSAAPWWCQYTMPLSQAVTSLTGPLDEFWSALSYTRIYHVFNYPCALIFFLSESNELPSWQIWNCLKS